MACAAADRPDTVGERLLRAPRTQVGESSQRISLHSAPGEGSAFTIVLPLSRAEAQDAPLAAAPVAVLSRVSSEATSVAA